MSSSYRFSANLGFLWKDQSLPDAIIAAAQAGFDAVECHWPYDTNSVELREALNDVDLPLLGINTEIGDIGMFGMSAVPGKVELARDAIIKSLDYASAVGSSAVHVMAGRAQGPDAQDVFLENLNFACMHAQPRNIKILIEPINSVDVQGYFLNTPDQASQIITAVNHPSLKMMFDCYHVVKMGLDIMTSFTQHQPDIGHIQFAGVPMRGRPDQGIVNYHQIFQHMQNLGWNGFFGAEYKPEYRHKDDNDTAATMASLGWLNQYQ